MNKKSNPSGFTLLEVLIALAIFAISVVALYHSVGTSYVASRLAEEYTFGTQLARQRLTEIRILVETENARGAFPDEKEEKGVFDKPFERFRWSYVIRKVQIPFFQPSDGPEVTVGQSTDGKSSSGIPSQTIGNAANDLSKIASKKISESVRELRVTVAWGDEGENEEKIVLTTHLVKLR